MALIYVTGGAKSGKSMFAEELLLGMNNGNQKNIYLATSVAFDEEMKAKVALHKERRQDKWLTVEGYKNFSETLKDVFSDETNDNLIVDCLTNMISNIIFEEQDINWDEPSEKDFEKCNISVEKQVNELINVINRFENTVIVSNELGMGIVPSYPLGRYFREIAGKMNQKIAEIADEAYFVVSGIPMKIKQKQEDFMLRKVILILFLMLFFSCNDKELEKDFNSFKYTERLTSDDTGRVEIWELNCEKLECRLSYFIGDDKKELFSKKIVLKDTTEMKKMVKKIFKDMKNEKNPESHSDFYPENILVLDNKEVFSTDRMNTGFYKLLDKLLNEKHYDFEDRIGEEFYKKLENERRTKIKTRITGLLENIKEAEYKNFRYEENINLNEIWDLECKNLDCEIKYGRNIHEEPLFYKKITLKSNKDKERIIKKILKGIMNTNLEKEYNSLEVQNYLYLNDKSEDIFTVINSEFHEVLTELLGENYKNIHKRLIKEDQKKEKEENLNILRNNNIIDFYYFRSETDTEGKENEWYLDCKNLTCNISYFVQKDQMSDSKKNFQKKWNQKIKHKRKKCKKTKVSSKISLKIYKKG